MIIALVAAKHLRPGAPGTTALRTATHVGKAGYQTQSSNGGRQLRGRGSKLLMQLLDYLRNGVGKVVGNAPSGPVSAGSAFSKTAAGRLHSAMPRGQTWFSRLARFAPKSIKNSSYMRTLTKRVSSQFVGWPGVARFVGLKSDAGRFAFSGGGKWSPYMRQFASSLRGVSGKGTASSAQAIMAQIQRQAIACATTQERRDMSTLSPVFGDLRVRILGAMDGAENLDAKSDTSSKHARKRLGGRNKAPRRSESSAATEDAGHAIEAKADVDHGLHPVAEAVQRVTVPMARCVTITVPYAPSFSSAFVDAGDPSSEQVFKALAAQQQAQQRHDLLLSRLIERLSATGWNVQYKQVDLPVVSLQIGLPPSTGVTTARACEALLCDWGFDVSLFAATVRNPQQPVAPSSEAAGARAAATAAAAARSTTSSKAFDSSGSEDIDSRLFSLIVDEVVDPDEAYREDVRDFLEELEQMPQLPRASRSASQYPGMSRMPTSSPTSPSVLYV
ncbi:hypothetical protein GGI11_003127 [Coemansia sp. RSA 2049]|nr:hypothetical protein GGI11_003127 [Coemansia sp. RSA 2049]